MSVTIKFLGAAGTVTGSKYLLEDGKHSILVDVGIFQGEPALSQRNWAAPALELSKVDAVLVTHAHIDHIGILPRYHALGLNCPVFMTEATSTLSRVLLLDSGRLQEEEAQYRMERKKSRHNPPLPLYTEAQAEAALKLRQVVPYYQKRELLPGVKAEWRRMGHIVGATSITLEFGGKIINFSGDIGRYSVPILKDPEPVEFGDLLLIESTYGDRVHAKEDPKIALAEIINRTSKRGGVVVIPSFAVGRAQLLLYYLRELKEQHLISNIPVIIDSPMAAEASAIYSAAKDDYDQETLNILQKGRAPFILDKLGYTKGRGDSIKLNSIDEPMIIISASGMLGGGRILHHLKHRLADPRNTILFVGFQPPGSRGDLLKNGAPSISLFGDEIPVRAEIAELSMLSAHADRDEMLRWCKSSAGKPGKVAIVHGELPSARQFSFTLEKELGWSTFVPQHLEQYTI